MKVNVPESDLRELLREYLDIKTVPRKLLSEFKDYLDIDVPQWLRDNAKSFNRKLCEEGRFDEHGRLKQ